MIDKTTLDGEWRNVTIELRSCSSFYLNFYPLGHETDESARKFIQLSSIQSSPFKGNIDIQLLDSVDELNGIFPNRLLLNFRDISSIPDSTTIKLRVRLLESKDSILIRTGRDEPDAKIKVIVSTRNESQTVLDTQITFKPRYHKLVWEENPTPHKN